MDKIFDVIERHRHAAAVYFAASAGPEDAPVDVQKAMCDAFDALEATAPTTFSGLIAKVRYFTRDGLPMDPYVTSFARMICADFDRIVGRDDLLKSTMWPAA
jgi:hypothetical protein